MQFKFLENQYVVRINKGNEFSELTLSYNIRADFFFFFGS
jgi:hypothetical protein